MNGAKISTPPVAQAEHSTGAEDGAAGGVRGAATVFSDLASVSGARVGSAVLSVITVVITTRLLGPSGYALIAYVTVISTLMFTVTSAWTAAAVTRYGREEIEQRHAMTATSWGRLTMTAPLVLVAALAIAGLKLAGALPAEMTWLFVWLALASGLLTIASEHIVNLLEASGRMKLTAVGLTLRQVVVVVVLAALFIAGSRGSPAVVLALNLGALAVVVAVFAIPLWRVGLWPPAFDRELIGRMFGFSVPLIAFSVSQYVIRSVDVVVLRTYGSAVSVGVYAVAYQGYSVLQQIATTATIVLTPLFVSLGSAGRHALVRRYVARTIPQLAFLSAMLAGAAIPLLGLAVPIVFGHAFHAAAAPLAILFSALALYAAASFVAPILMLNERSRAIALVNVVAAAINAGGDVLFVGPLHMGVAGPALATTLALSVIVFGYLLVSFDCVQVTRQQLAPWRGGTALFAPLAAATAPALLLPAELGAAVGLFATALTGAAILRWASPFGPQDAGMLEKLDMPAAMKRLALRGVRLAAR